MTTELETSQTMQTGAQPDAPEPAVDASQSAAPPPSRRILSTEAEVSRFDRWVEFVAAVVLSLATVATAWAGYQAALWGGDQTQHMAAANAATVQAAQLSNQEMQRMSLHANLFVAWVTAVSNEEQELADFLYQRFPGELKVAADAWIATDPRVNPEAPATPFQMKEYVLPETAEANAMRQKARDETAEANASNEVSDRYVLLTVIFASVLFFGGISGKFQSKAVDLGMLGVAACIFLVGLAILFTYPVD